MRIKRLELNGFKSFPEKTVIPFPKGISGVVGPNGCGKSNIVDAIKWVMGEQSPRQLRGKGMEDVIFSGSNGKSSVGMAEVSLVLENDNGTLPPELAEFSEVVITRRLFRDGESEYAINNHSCRLKDITHLFMDTGIGSRTYAVIEQGRVGAIIDSKPEDRRHWIEEAAGISKYKHRKHETLRKLELTQQNLLRVGDVIAEVKRQMNSLYRQAKKAERYKEARQELKQVELTLTARDYREVLESTKSLEGELVKNRQASQSLRAESLEVEQGLNTLGVRLEEIENELRNNQEHYYQQKSARDRQELLQNQTRQEQVQLEGETRDLEKELTEIGVWLEAAEQEASGLRRELETYTERLAQEEQRVVSQQDAVAALKKETQQVQEEVEINKDRLLTQLNEQTRVRNQLLGLVQLREDRRQRLTRQAEEKSQLTERIRHLKSLSVEAGQTLAGQQQLREELHTALETRQLWKKEQETLRQGMTAELLSLEKSLHEDRVQRTNLQDLQNSYQVYQNGVRALFQGDFFARFTRRPEALRLLAQGIETEPGYETAVESALGEALQAVIVDEPQEARQGIELLKSSGAGRATFISIQPPFTDAGPEPTAAINGYRPLLEKVTAREELQGWLKKLLGAYLLVPTIEEGLEMCRGLQGKAAVTPEGDIITGPGIISGGSRANEESGILVQKNRIKLLDTRIREWADRLAEKGAGLQIQEETVRETEALILEEEERIREVQQGIQEGEKILFGYQEEAKPIQRRLEILSIEEEEIRVQVLEEDSQEEVYHREEASLAAGIASLKTAIRERETAVRELEQKLEEGREAWTGLQTGFSAMKEKGEHLAREWARMEETLGDRRNRSGKLRDRLAQGGRIQEELGRRLAEGGADLERLGEELKTLESGIEERNQARSAILGEKGREEQTLKEKRLRLEEMEAVEKELRLQNAQLQMRMEHLREKAWEQFGLDPQQIFEAAQPAPEELTALEGRRRELKEKLEQMGEVNLVAIEEYQAFKERHDFYQTQEEDLQKAMESLRRAIQKINGTSKEMFLNTFKAIQENMDRVFPVLFGGGTVKLSLTNEEEPLDAGVDIIVHPPGKKVTNMSLLSGGEKALTALALIFSIYMVKPSPFCLLDEIDAFLDEANVERFKKFVSGLVRDSQVILVTHNRRIMELADALYGVTMEQPGISKLVSVRMDNLQN